MKKAAKKRKTAAKRGKKKVRRCKKTLNTRIPKSLTWIERYLRRVSLKMPTMPMPSVIRPFKPQLGKRHRTLGSCCRADRTINLATHTIEEVVVNGRRKRVLKPLSHYEILLTLAHELSHLVYDHHAYEHEWYGRTIFNTFGVTECCPRCNGKGKIAAEYVND